MRLKIALYTHRKRPKTSPALTSNQSSKWNPLAVGAATISAVVALSVGTPSATANTTSESPTSIKTGSTSVAGSNSVARNTSATRSTLVAPAVLVSPPLASTTAANFTSVSEAASESKPLPQQVPTNLYMPPNPPAPGKMKATELKLTHLLAQRSTNYNHASPSQAKNIELIAKRLNGTVLQPGQTFSYNRKLGPYTEQNGYGWGRAFSGNRIVPSLGGGVCQGASTLYSTLIRTGTATFVERHAHSLTVPYLPAGEDATVSYSSHLDFRFKNTSSMPIMIGAAGYPEKRILTIAVWGAKPVPEIHVRHKILAVYPYRTVRTSASAAGSNPVLAPGQVGCKVHTWLEVVGDEGYVKKDLGIDTYKPSPRIVQK